MPAQPLSSQIMPQEVSKCVENGEKVTLIDVREPFEHQIARLNGSELIPMKTLVENLSRFEELAGEATLVVYCHHGIRSLNAVSWLRDRGILNCQSLAGGIDRWSLEIDSNIPRY